MNERIKELALEARIAYYSKNGSYEGADDGFSVIPSTQSLEKFARLLIEDTVKQCVEFAEYQLQIGGTNADKIKQHFGVK